MKFFFQPPKFLSAKISPLNVYLKYLSFVGVTQSNSNDPSPMQASGEGSFTSSPEKNFQNSSNAKTIDTEKKTVDSNKDDVLSAPPGYSSLFPTESIEEEFPDMNIVVPTTPVISDIPPQYPVTNHQMVSLPADLPKYKMSSNPRGICLILSNSNFKEARERGKNLRDRPGTKIDVERITKTFSDLKFKVKCHEELPAQAMFQALSYFAMNIDHSQYDCFVCFILTHGNDSGLFGVDGEDIKINYATSLFEPIDKLKGKPKLFFFQACRGVSETKSYKKDSCNFGDNDNSYLSQYSVPLGSDFFLGYATPPGKNFIFINYLYNFPAILFFI